MEACFEVQGGASDFAVSQKVRVTGHLGKREVSHTAVVTAMRPARLFEWRFEDRYGVKGLERWELEPVEAVSPGATPRTVVRMRSEYTMPGIFGEAMDWLDDTPRGKTPQSGLPCSLRRSAEHGAKENQP